MHAAPQGDPAVPAPSDARTIGVVIPAYDAAAFIADALDTVARLSRPPAGCVVVDDGSADDTAGIVARWAERHPAVPLELVRLEHEGAAAARSAGVMACQCDLVALLDADDLLLEGALATLAAGFDAWPDTVACFANAERMLVGGKIGTDYLTGKPLWRLPHEARDVEVRGAPVEMRRIMDGAFESLLGGSYIANCAALVSREAAISAGLWSDEFPTAEDRDFWLRLTRQGPFAYSPVHVARVRYHDHNLSAERGSAAHATDAARVLQKMGRLADELGLGSHEREAVRTALERAVDQALYAASRAGPRTFRHTISLLDDATTRVPWANPRHLARVILSPFMRARRRGREPASPA